MRGNITQRSPGSWTIQVSGGFTDAGKRVRITRTVRGPERDAQKTLTALLREVDTGTAVLSGHDTFGRYLTDRWLPHMRSRIRPSTWRRYEGLVRVQLVPRVGRVKLAAIRPHHLQHALDGMLADRAAPASVLQAHRIASAALKQAVRWQLLAVSPAAGVSPPRPERAPLRVPNPDETRRILVAAQATAYEIPILLAATTGARRGEVLGLAWSEVDLDRGVVRVIRTLQRVGGVPTFVSPKTARSRRTISLPATVIARLRRHRADQLERRMLLGAAWNDTDLVVDVGDGSPIDPDTLGHAFGRIAASVNLPDVRLHDLRHGFASTLLAAGVNVKVVSEALGHASSSFTLDTYAHVLPTMGEQVATAIETALGGGEVGVDEARRCEASTSRGHRCKNPPAIGRGSCPIHDGPTQPESLKTRVAREVARIAGLPYLPDQRRD